VPLQKGEQLACRSADFADLFGCRHDVLRGRCHSQSRPFIIVAILFQNFFSALNVWAP